MSKTVFEFPSSDGRTNIRAVKYVPENSEIKAVVQISHGMVEFIDRYEEFAQFLNERGILVAGNDHLGHGGSIVSEDDYGYFSKNDGYLNVLKDLHELTLLIKKDYPDLNYFFIPRKYEAKDFSDFYKKYGRSKTLSIIKDYVLELRLKGTKNYG